MYRSARFRGLSRYGSRFVLSGILLFWQIGLSAQPRPVYSAPKHPIKAMKTFVILFRQGPRSLTEVEKQQRAEETRQWARSHNQNGHKLEPRMLAAKSVPLGAKPSDADTGKVTALLFFEAQDLSKASQIAQSHPALRYGATAEVRAWSRPTVNPPTANAPATPELL